MATRAWSEKLPTWGGGEQMPAGVAIIEWTGLLNGDDGEPFLAPHRADKSVEVTGTFGAAGNLQVQGTNAVGTPVSADWKALSDQSGTALNVTAAGIKMIAENTMQIRPKVTAGDGTTSLAVRLLVSTPVGR